MFFILLLLWIVFNGKFSVEILIFGVFVCGALYAFMYRFLGYSPKTEFCAAKRFFRAILYVLNLIKEIFIANFLVIYYIYSPKIEVEPSLVTFTAKFREKFHSVVLADSITLTPGTVTVFMENDELTVHCLDRDLGKDLDRSSFVQMLYASEMKEGGKKNE